MKTCIEERNLVSEFERRIITTRYIDNFSTVHVASHACMYCYRPMSALTSQQREGALPLENARPISDPSVQVDDVHQDMYISCMEDVIINVNCTYFGNHSVYRCLMQSRLEMFTCPAPDIVTGMNNRISARTDWLSRS